MSRGVAPSPARLVRRGSVRVSLSGSWQSVVSEWSLPRLLAPLNAVLSPLSLFPRSHTYVTHTSAALVFSSADTAPLPIHFDGKYHGGYTAAAGATSAQTKHFENVLIRGSINDANGDVIIDIAAAVNADAAHAAIKAAKKKEESKRKAASAAVSARQLESDAAAVMNAAHIVIVMALASTANANTLTQTIAVYDYSEHIHSFPPPEPAVPHPLLRWTAKRTFHRESLTEETAARTADSDELRSPTIDDVVRMKIVAPEATLLPPDMCCLTGLWAVDVPRSDSLSQLFSLIHPTAPPALLQRLERTDVVTIIISDPSEHACKIIDRSSSGESVTSLTTDNVVRSSIGVDGKPVVRRATDTADDSPATQPSSNGAESSACASHYKRHLIETRHSLRGGFLQVETTLPDRIGTLIDTRILIDRTTIIQCIELFRNGECIVRCHRTYRRLESETDRIRADADWNKKCEVAQIIRAVKRENVFTQSNANAHMTSATANTVTASAVEAPQGLTDNTTVVTSPTSSLPITVPPPPSPSPAPRGVTDADTAVHAGGSGQWKFDEFDDDSGSAETNGDADESLDKDDGDDDDDEEDDDEEEDDEDESYDDDDIDEANLVASTDSVSATVTALSAAYPPSISASDASLPPLPPLPPAPPLPTLNGVWQVLKERSSDVSSLLKRMGVSWMDRSMTVNINEVVITQSATMLTFIDKSPMGSTESRYVIDHQWHDGMAFGGREGRVRLLIDIHRPSVTVETVWLKDKRSRIQQLIEFNRTSEHGLSPNRSSLTASSYRQNGASANDGGLIPAAGWVVCRLIDHRVLDRRTVLRQVLTFVENESIVQKCVRVMRKRETKDERRIGEELEYARMKYAMEREQWEIREFQRKQNKQNAQNEETANAQSPPQPDVVDAATSAVSSIVSSSSFDESSAPMIVPLHLSRRRMSSYTRRWSTATQFDRTEHRLRSGGPNPLLSHSTIALILRADYAAAVYIVVSLLMLTTFCAGNYILTAAIMAALSGWMHYRQVIQEITTATPTAQSIHHRDEDDAAAPSQGSFLPA